MNQTNAAITSNITIIPPRPDNLRAAMEELHLSQIDLGYRYSALALANALMSEVGAIFPQHMILIYLTTSYKRRQVWNAYIAVMSANPDNLQPITNPEDVRAKLMNTSSKELLQEAYGSVPEGLIQALGRLELKGQEPRIYLLLHKFMENSPSLRKSFSHASKIKASTVTALTALSKPLKNYELAKQFRDQEDIKTLLFMIDTLARGDNQKYIELCANVVTAAKRGHSVTSALKQAYYQTPFPDPLVPDTEFCKHIGTCGDLRKAAIQFKNCLRDYCESGIRGEYVFHRIFDNNRPVAVVSLREDSPYGFCIFEIQGKQNECIGDELEQKIVKHFEKHGVYKMSSMEALLRELGSMLNRGRRRGDPADDINMYIDELLEDGPN